jgi:putative hydrolase of the HAD superfamily
MRSGIVFDIDDTLYLERDYVYSGFRAVSQLLADAGLLSFTKANDYLKKCFEQGVRHDTFNRLLGEVPHIERRFSVQELVEAYRCHTPEIDLMPGMHDLLEHLRVRGARLGVISDGVLRSQQRKVTALDLERLVEETVLTDTWGREYWKPNPRAFLHLSTTWGLTGDRMVYIGDNPAKDFVAPNRLQWRTIRLRLVGQLRSGEEAVTREQAPRVTVSSIDELHDWLEAWARGP